MLQKDEVYDCVAHLVSGLAGVDAKQVHPLTCLYRDLRLGSVDTLDIFFGLEKKIAKKINFSEFYEKRAGRPQDTLTVQEIVDFISA